MANPNYSTNFDPDKIKKSFDANKGMLWAVLIGLVVLYAFFNCFVIVGAGERGVVLNFGAVDKSVLEEGLHFLIPGYQKVVTMDVKVQKSQVECTASSKDLQEAHSIIAVNYHISPERANFIYQKIGRDFKDRIMDPAVQEVVKAVTARYTAVELITLREKIRTDIKDLLKSRLTGYDVMVDDFSILNFKFSPEFATAIEQKQTAEQLALKAPGPRPHQDRGRAEYHPRPCRGRGAPSAEGKYLAAAHPAQEDRGEHQGDREVGRCPPAHDRLRDSVYRCLEIRVGRGCKETAITERTSPKIRTNGRLFDPRSPTTCYTDNGLKWEKVAGAPNPRPELMPSTRSASLNPGGAGLSRR